MKIILSLALSLLFSIVFAQGSGFRSEGREFYLGYLHPSFNKVVPPQTSGFYRVYACVSSAVSTQVNVSYFDKVSTQETYPKSYTIKSGFSVMIPLDRSRMTAVDTGDAAEYIACHITAKHPIAVQYLSSGANSGGSYLALPVSSWGRKYVVASYDDNGSGAGALLGGRGPSELDLAAGYFTIVAAYNNTTVTIIPTARTAGLHTGVNQGPGATGVPRPYTATLQRGQCYMVKSWSASQEGEDDISASIVKADKPVAVISGHEDANVGDGSVGGRSLEARDFMIEQMIPVEFWDHTGYITTPMVDSPGNNGEGLGEDILVYVSDENTPSTVTVHRPDEMKLAPRTYQRPAQISNAITPAHFFSASGTKFMVVQYDLRNHGTGAPYPAPSMMTIIPKALWSNAYLWYVPTDVDERLQAYFVTVIGVKDGTDLYYEPGDTILKRNWFSDSIIVSINGSKPGKIISGLGSVLKTWNNIPDYPELKAVTYRVSPGTSYYLNAPYPVMVYHYGNRGVDFDRDLGDFDNDDNFFTYASPVGASLADRTIKNNLSITVDTLCTGWRICATDTNSGGGIRFVSLISDPLGDLFPPKARQFSNCSILSPDDPSRLGEFHLTGDQQSYCFTINVDDPGSSSNAPIAIYDKAGNYRILELSRKPQQVSITPSITDSIYHFSAPKIGEKSCVRFVFKNFAANSDSYTITSLSTSTSNFTVSSIVPALPAVIAPGDTLGFTVCFETVDTMVHRDTVVFGATCLGFRIPMEAVGANPVLVATDVDFGNVSTNEKVCKTVQLRNAGTVAFTISGANFVPNTGRFFLDSASAKMLPRTLPPGTILTLSVCYFTAIEGPDTARIDWVNDIQPPFATEHRPYSLLTSRGVKSGLEWDRIIERMYVETGKEVFSRIYLKNIGMNTATIDKITLTGTDAAEFRLVGIQNSTYTIVAFDSAWVEVAFKPDMARPTTQVRKAELQAVAKSNPAEIKFVNLEGIIITSDVNDNKGSNGFSIHPNPAKGRLTIDLQLKQAGDVSVAIYDVLGREVLGRKYSGSSVGMNSINVDLPKISGGSYTVIVRAGELARAFRVVIE